MKFQTGRRVYVPSTGTFGTIVREGGILGLARSYAVVDDLGKQKLFVGEDIEFVDVDSSETLSGEKVKLPEDVVPALRAKYSPAEARQKTIDLYNLCPADRGKASKDLLNQPSKTKKKTPSRGSRR